MKTHPFRPQRRVFLLSAASVVGQKEKAGPLGVLFDLAGDDRFGKDTWEKSEAEMQRLALSLAKKKGSLADDDLDALFAGDLINQCISSSYGLSSFRVPYFGIFGACSTSAEGLLLSMLACSAHCDRAAAVTSSHYCTAERQFRLPIEYGGQRAPTAQWTVTGAGAFITTARPEDLQASDTPYAVEIVEAMPGCIVDRGIKDANNMGAAMAPAAVDTLCRYFSAGYTPGMFDWIVTGDLGREGSGILRDLLLAEGVDLDGRHVDCGQMIFTEGTDTHAGGSGCGCSATVLAANILPQLERGTLHDVLYMATGALMNPMAINQKQAIPGIAHLVRLRAVPRSSILSEIASQDGGYYGNVS